MVHLHLHLEYSFLDSNIRINKLLERVKNLGMKSVAVTDHGNISAHVDFYKACLKEGIKPILGCELYVCCDINNKDTDNRYDHMIAIAKNDIGYKNLKKLVSLGYTDGFYYKPRVDMSLIEKYKEGIIFTSACLGGDIQQMILSGKFTLRQIKDRAVYYSRTLDDFYLEIQAADNLEQRRVNRILADISRETGIPLVASSDAHFLTQDDFESHGVFIKMSKSMSNELYQDCWVKDEFEMVEVLEKHIDIDTVFEAIENTHKISDMCNVTIELGKSYLPDFPIPEGFESEDEYLWELVRRGWRERNIHRKKKEKQAVYRERLKYEFDIIKRKGFSGYFLHVRNILKICEKNGIFTGDGRGSADNSLICYIVGITNVDSVKYDLNFSRFLTIGRKALPDVDMDIQSSRKQELIDLLKAEYGDDRVAQIGTFLTLQAKASIESVGKVLGVQYITVNDIKKLIPDQTSLQDAIDGNDKLKEYTLAYPDLFKYALEFEGIKRGMSVHAGGVVLVPSSKEMADFTSVALSKDKEIITQYEMHNVEEVGLVKMDVLGIVTLDIIKDTLDLIDKKKGYIDVSTIDFQNSETFKLIQGGFTDGVFQLESSGMKDTCMRVKPQSMEDIIAILALYRPDTMRELEHYIARKHGLEEVTYLHPDLIPILQMTYGSLIYQEQVMEITRVFAGFDDEEADEFRKGIGKKDQELVQALADKFEIRAIENGYDVEIIKELTAILRKMGGYLFNKGHASGYGITTFKTAFLKANHPVEFMCSLISNQRKENGTTDYESIGIYISTCKEMGIKVSNPDVNFSKSKFFPYKGSILYGLGLVKGIGDEPIKAIESIRPIKDFNDFYEKTKDISSINKTVVISLIKSGAFDFSGASRKELLEEYGQLRFFSGAEEQKPIKSINKNHINQLLVSKIIREEERENKELCLRAFNKLRLALFKDEWKSKVLEGDEFDWEFQTLSTHLKGDPFEGHSLPSWSTYENEFEYAKFFGTVTAINKKKIKSGRNKGKTMAFINFSTPEGTREGICFSETWEKHQKRLDKGSLVVIRGTKQDEQCVISDVLEFKKWVARND